LCGHRDLPLTEARIRGAIAALEEVGYLARIAPEPGRRYQRTADGLHRQPLAFHFGAEFQATFDSANKRPRCGSRAAHDERRPLPASPLPATRPRSSWSPPEQRTNSPKNTPQNPTFVNLGELAKKPTKTSLLLPESHSRDSGVEAALRRLGEAIRAKLHGGEGTRS
jgi:hypothetical protein